MATLILCLKIFFVRILDVSLGTLRTMITVKGKNLYASLIGFFEILVWFLIVKEALNTDNTSIWVAISYALGFATGTYLGGILSSKFISGNLSLQIITNKLEIVNKLRDKMKKKILFILLLLIFQFQLVRLSNCLFGSHTTQSACKITQF